MFMNKKGVSPIIAAILLVVITIAIGATTMAFIRGLSDQNIESAQAKSSQIKCGTDVNLEVLSVNNAYKVCAGQTASNVTWFSVTLKNKGFVDIKRMKLTVLGDGSTGFATNESIANDEFSVNTIKKYNISFTNSSLAPIQEYVLEPVIQGEPGQDIYCEAVAISWNAANLETTC